MPARREVAACLVLLSAALCARAAHAVPSTLSDTTVRQAKPGDDGVLRFIAYFLVRGELSNIAPENDLLQGQTIGRLFGPNSTRTSDKLTAYIEQRLIPFFIFEPRILNRFARLRASFDIRWTWGDTNYGVGGSFGGAINGHQVNIQTANLQVELNLPWRGWYVNIGLQRLYDSPRDPFRTFFSTLALTGDRLAFWGADAVGVQLYGLLGPQTFRLGFFDLYENKIGEDDNVILFEAVTDRWLGRTLHLGGHVRYLRDSSSGAGGVSVLGQGPASKLTDYNGAYRFPIRDPAYHAHIVWVGVDGSYNPEFTAGRLGASFFAVGNFGQILAGPDRDSLAPAAAIAGAALNLRLGYRYGRTRGDVVVGEAIYASGDADGAADGLFTGVVTGNTWGAPGAAFTSHGAYLLLPHINVVNRFYAAVHDLSNVGYGLTAVTVNASYDLVRNVLTAKVGGAAAASAITPQDGGNFIGIEANAMLAYQVRAFLSIEAHGAYLWLGSFYDSPSVAPREGRPRDPWTAFLCLKWLMF